MLDFNTEPYNDDFDENNKFYRILFRPSFAVQARELTQLQTILQKQIEFNGSHIFKQGAMVVPGQASLDVKYNYVKLQQIYDGEDIETYINNLDGLTVIGATTGVTAQIIKIVHVEGTDPTTLYVRYSNSGTDNVTKVFEDGEVLTTLDDEYSVLVAASDATGIGSAATIQRGVYYINGYYVLCDEQTIILDKYSNKPSYRIGLLVDEQKITSEDAGYEMLLDNAQNSFNYAAPGAHRYYIDLILTKLPLYTSAKTWFAAKTFEFGDFIKSGNLYYKVTVGGVSGVSAPAATENTTNGDLSLQFIASYNETTDTSSDENFIQLITCSNGDVQKIINSTKYSEIEKTLATRTFDESGNYTVVPFKMDVREHRNNNRGEWLESISYLVGDVITSSGYTYVAKTNDTSVGTGTPKVGPSHTSGDAYDGVSSTGVYWEYNENPFYNRGIYTAEDGGDEAKLALGMQPGSAYVQGYQIEKVAVEYLSIDKARDNVQLSDVYVPTPVGNYVLVTNINSMPPFDSLELVNLYDRLTTAVGVEPLSFSDGGSIGTARVRGIEWHSGDIGTQNAIYKLFLFDVTLITGKSFNRNVKSFYFSRSDTNLNFTADIQPVTTLLRGTATSGSIASPSSSETIVGAGTLFENDLTVNDYIYLDSTVRRVTTITGDNGITVDGAISKTAANVSLLTTEILQPQAASLLYPLGSYAVKSVRDSNGDKQIIYYTTEYCSAIAGSDDGATCDVIINVPNGGVFASGDATDNYVVVYNDSGAGGAVIEPASFSAGGSSSMTITIDDSYAGDQILVMATVLKTGADGREKTKSLTNTTSSYNTQVTATKSSLVLQKADIYRIRSVKMDAVGTFSSPSGTYTIDITDRYDIDDGQRDTHYDLGRLNLKHSYAPPSAPIRVDYDYFSHGTGDYFTLDSYTDIEYKDIPAYKGNSLRDYIDFRPRIDDTGVDFTSSGSSFSPLLKRGQDITTDYSFYLPRKNKIGLDFQGRFFDIKGIPAIQPIDPPNPALGMILYNLMLEPYTFGTDTKHVLVTKLENKRYTMRDIGALEKRIENIEYYTSLTLLEENTKTMSIQDENGLDRFKNGFIVDNFNGHGIGNTNNPDYLCSIDMQNNILRSFCVQNNVNLIEKNTSNNQRAANNYKLYGDVITLPVVEDVVLAQNQYASRLENINPFAVFTFLGNVKLNPSSDDWFEVDRRADIINNIEGNYNTIQTLAEKAGVLGTVWNAWQDIWAGVPYVTSIRMPANARIPGGVPIWSSAPIVEISAQEITQQRQGVKTTVVAKIDNQIVDDKILSTAIIPYTRKRNVLVQVKGLKPDTRFYTYFDGIAVSSYCTPASYLTYTLTAGTDFDSSTNSGGNSTETARLIKDVSGSYNSDTAGNMALNIGDVVSDSNGATAVVIGKDYNDDTNTRRLHVINIIGTFVSGHTITGSISGATGTVVSPVPVNSSQNDELISNFNGELNFLFWIQNSNELKFRTGTREFKLIDADTSGGLFTSSGRVNYSATGILQTKQRTINAVRNAEIVQQAATENQTIYRTSERVAGYASVIVGYYDPLAQTFLVQSTGGAFLSKVDIFFATKDSKLPVTLEIREVINGYPGQNVLAFSRVTLKPEQVNISSTLVALTDGTDTEYPKYDTPTSFTFPSPVYVQDNAEYAIVLASDSNNYRAWISQVGDKIPGSTRTISEQPYNGVLFKSQNASTWTADQNQDLKFTVWRSKFDTSVIGNVKLHNDILPVKDLELNPFEVVSATNKVRVWQKNHGLFDGSLVTLTNSNTAITDGAAATGTIATAGTGTTTVTGTLFTTDIGAVGTSAAGTVLYKTDGTYIGVVASITSATELELVANSAVAIASSVSYKFAASINGIPVTEIYDSHTISDVDLDSYVITVSSDATLSGYGGGSTVRATYNVLYDSIQPCLQVQTFPDTTLESYLNTTTGKSIDGSETPYINYSANVDSNYNAVALNDNNYFYYPCVIASQENEIDSALSGVKSVTLKCRISSTNDALSPIIDTHRASLILVSNKINNPSETNINVSELDDRLLFTDDFEFDGATITSTDSGVRDLMKTIIIGKYVTIAGATTPENDGTYLVTNLTDDGITGTITVDGIFDTNESSGAGTTLTLRNLFVDEIAPSGGSVINKYISRIINLANPSSFLKITYAAFVPSESNVLVYYKTSQVASTLDFNNTPWTLLPPDAPLVKSEHMGTDTLMNDNNHSVKDLAQFDALAVKIVMISTNSAAVPQIKDLRIIACA